LQSFAMEDSRILKYFEGKTIFITGASGFLAKIFLEKILRLQPKVKKIFLLLRPTTEKTIEERLHEEIFSSELFRVLNERNSPEVNHVLFAKVIPVCGDIVKENVGITDSELRDEMWGAIDIFVNSAATTRFDERYDVALGINALGALNVEKFARNCAKLEMLLHVSTAFVSGNKLGLIQEKPFQMGETLHGATIPYLDINMEKRIAEERLRELQNLNVTEKEITRAMRDLGI
ncbi:SDR family oxidoreductase, partial [Acinetobacter baumannii]